MVPNHQAMSTALLFIANFMEYQAVRLVDRHLLAMHDNQSLLEIDIEEGHRIGCMIQRYQVPVVREQNAVLRIITGYRQAQELAELTRLVIDLKYRDRVVPCIRADQIVRIIREIQSRGCRIRRMVVIERRDALHLLEFGLIVLAAVGEYIDGILELIDDV